MAEIFSFLSLGFIPIMSAIIILHGLIKRAPIYDYFIEGAKTGLRTALDILPFLVGIFIAVNSLTASGVLNLIDVALSPVLDLLDIPAQLLPLMFLRAISGKRLPHHIAGHTRTVRPGLLRRPRGLRVTGGL